MLSLKTRRMTGKAWVESRIEPGDRLFLHGAARIPGRKDGPCDTIALVYTLNRVQGLEKLRQDVRTVMKFLKPGGRLVAVARACDSGQELAQRMVESCYSPRKIPVTNLTNKEIVALRPNRAVFLQSFVSHRVVGQNQSVQRFVQRVLQTDDEIRDDLTLPDIFPVKLLDVGLEWQKNES